MYTYMYVLDTYRVEMKKKKNKQKETLPKQESVSRGQHNLADWCHCAGDEPARQLGGSSNWYCLRRTAYLSRLPAL